MIIDYPVGTTNITTLLLPDENCLIRGQGRQQSIVNFQSIVGTMTSPDRLVEIRDLTLNGYGADPYVRFTFGPAAVWKREQVSIERVDLSANRLELGECWMPTLTKVIIQDCQVGIRSVGRVMGLGGNHVRIFPKNDVDAMGVWIDAADSEGGHFDNWDVVGGRDGWYIDLPTPKPGWHWRGAHADTTRFGVFAHRTSQAFFSDCLFYRRGAGTDYNGVNPYESADFVKIAHCHFVNNGTGRVGASAIVLGAGVVQAKVIGGTTWQGFENGLWIQPGVSKARYNDCGSHDTTTPVLNQGTGTVAGNMIVT